MATAKSTRKPRFEVSFHANRIGRGIDPQDVLDIKAAIASEAGEIGIEKIHAWRLTAEIVGFSVALADEATEDQARDFLTRATRATGVPTDTEGVIKIIGKKREVL